MSLNDPGKPAAKLAEIVADELEQEIIRAGWPTGSLIGSEAQLAQRFNVSRSIIRETVGQLERRGIASTRRGNGGGLIVSAPARDASVTAISNYLEFAGMDIAHILETRALLEIQAAGLAAKRISDTSLKELKATAQKLRAFTGNLEDDYRTFLAIRRTIAESSGNDLLSLFVQALDLPVFEITLMTATNTSDYYALMSESGRVKQSLVEAIADCDAPAAQHLAQSDTALMISGYQTIFARQSADAAGARRPSEPKTKFGHALALRLSRDIKAAAYPPGHPLGSEPELMEKYGVGRTVFRESLRLLEVHSVVRTKRGVGGGVIVAQPDPAHTIDVAARYFNYMRLSPVSMLELREPLELGAVKLAARRLSDADRAKINDRLSRVAKAGDTSDSLSATIHVHQAICEASGNPVLALLIRLVLHALGESVSQRLSHQKQVTELTARSHQAIAGAIMAGDEGLAARSMLYHLSFLSTWYAKVLS